MTDSNSHTAQILIVEDEETLAEVLKLNLQLQGYRVDTAASAEQALALDLASYDLFLLDIMMGDISGIQLARILKQRHDTADIPIIFCTARDSEADMVEGLDIGADDYIAKPYTLPNISARIRAVLRRSSPKPVSTQSNATDTLSFQGLILSLTAKTCTVDGTAVKLPRKEFELLALFLSHRNRIFTREELISRIWPEQVIVADRVVDVNITRLRAKIAPYSNHIATRAGYGYGFVE